MSKIMQNIQIKTNETLTTNGDVAFKSTFNKNLDFFGLAGSMRNNHFQLESLFRDAYWENKLIAIKNLLYLRDARGGIGERDSYRLLQKVLRELDLKSTIAILPFISEIGRWDDLLDLVYITAEQSQYRTLQKAIIFLVKEQLKVDKKSLEEGENVSLLAKWMPSINASSEETRRRGRFFATVLFKGNKKQYRQTLSALREKIGIIETKLVNKEYDFDYNKIPAKALIRYTKAFIRNDEVRYSAWKDSLKKDSSKIAVRADKLFPYEIIRKMNEDKQLAEAMWSALPKESSNKKILVVRDGSGSMTWGTYIKTVTPLEIADSLTLYTAERLSGAFKNRFITFSSQPKFVDLSNEKSLDSKLKKLSRYDDMSNTDIEATYDLILEASKVAEPEDYLDAILIISDMQFDGGRNAESTYEAIKHKFKKANIPFPKMVYWNVNASKVQFPTTDIKGAQFVSGFSKNIIADILNGTELSAEKLMLSVLSKYDYLDQIIK